MLHIYINDAEHVAANGLTATGGPASVAAYVEENFGFASNAAEVVAGAIWDQYVMGGQPWVRVNDFTTVLYGPNSGEQPLPGDYVRVIGESEDPLVKQGALGVIEGVRGQYRELVSVCFNPSPQPWFGNVINSSGGPTYQIAIEDLQPTGETIEVMVTSGKPQRAGSFPAQVRVWEFVWRPGHFSWGE